MEEEERVGRVDLHKGIRSVVEEGVLKVLEADLIHYNIDFKEVLARKNMKSVLKLRIRS